MMDLSVIDRYIQEKQFKQYNHFLKLSKDTADSNALVSYWSLYCVMLSGIQSQDKNAEFRTFLSNIMTCLEEMKKGHKGDTKFANETDAKKPIEDYGNQLLVRAEQDAELGVSPGVTVKLYLTASTVYQMLAIMGDKSEENAKRIKYCKWKAVNTFKEAKEAENNPRPATPEAGNKENPIAPDSFDPYAPGGSANSGSDDAGINLPDPPSPPRSATPPPSPTPPPAQPPYTQPAAQTPTSGIQSLSLTESDLNKAELYCESALYAIKSRDIISAVDSLKQTLKVLNRNF